MEKFKATILIVDDEEKTRKVLKIDLQDNYRVLLAKNGNEAVQLLKDNNIHLILSDLRMPDMDGLELLYFVQQKHPNIPVIIITAYGSVENAVEAMKMGAYDYILKPVKIDELDTLINKSLHLGRLISENIELKERLKKYEGFNEIITINPKIKSLFEKINHVADTPATVLIEGESGTGKQLFAQAVHYLSKRADKPFIEINCGAIPHDLLESELFGHEKGSFTGAVTTRKGKFELADNGTLFLDEIGEMPLDLQVKLLHVLENQKFTRVGGTKFFETDTRIVAATNRNLQEEVTNGNFRQDLYYRLKVVSLFIPPLRERKEDIPLLVKHFLKKHQNLNPENNLIITDEAIKILQKYNWPGNIRELENTILQAVILAANGFITPDLLPEEIKNFYELNYKDLPLTKDALQEEKKKGTEKIIDDLEYKFLINLLKKTSGNISHAAELSGYNRRQIQNLIKKHNIKTDDFRY
ncbi:transcriptional regulatory protein QseF [bacterium BMS3Abin03]|nr:transcriptional regulatory protein QseF [bacterium BMS3Abin03]